YIFQNDIEGFDFISLLKSKAELGLEVKLLLDSFGSADLSRSSVSELERAGAEILTMSYLLHRMHRKVLVVDEKVAFIGGVNFHKISRLWNDLMVQIKGKLVKKVVASFAKSYKNAGGKDRELIEKGSQKKAAKEGAWIEEHSP